MGLKLRARYNLAGLKYQGGGPMLAFQLHRLTAIGILLFVGLHVLASFASQETGANWAGVVNDIYMSAWFQILVAFCVIYHSINGIRISLLDFFPRFLRFQREAIWVQWAVILPLFFMTAGLIVLLALRAG